MNITRLIVSVCVALALTAGVAAAAPANGTRPGVFPFTATYPDAFHPAATWHCAGVRLNKSDGSAADNEICKGTGFPPNTLIAGVYRSNATLNLNQLLSSSDPNAPYYGGSACGARAPGIPGEISGIDPVLGAVTVEISDFNDGLAPRCASSFTVTYVPSGNNVWYVLLNMNFRA